MHARIEGWICDRPVHEIDPSHKSDSFASKAATCAPYNSAFEEYGVATLGGCDCQAVLRSIRVREQDECRTANVVLQNHDVCPLGFPMFFLQESVSCSHLTGPCLYLASCRSCCSTRRSMDRDCLPCEMLNLKASRMSMTCPPVPDTRLLTVGLPSLFLPSTYPERNQANPVRGTVP